MTTFLNERVQSCSMIFLHLQSLICSYLESNKPEMSFSHLKREHAEHVKYDISTIKIIEY